MDPIALRFVNRSSTPLATPEMGRTFRRRLRRHCVGSRLLPRVAGTMREALGVHCGIHRPLSLGLIRPTVLLWPIL